LVAGIGENQFSEWQNGAIKNKVKPKQRVSVAQFNAAR
jgi:hypothetical protein